MPSSPLFVPHRSETLVGELKGVRDEGRLAEADIALLVLGLAQTCDEARVHTGSTSPPRAISIPCFTTVLEYGHLVVAMRRDASTPARSVKIDVMILNPLLVPL